MAEAKLTRHDLVYISRRGKERILNSLLENLTGKRMLLAKDILAGKTDVPGIIRRDDGKNSGIAIGFVHYCRLDGNRLRIGTFIAAEEILHIEKPHEVLLKNFNCRTCCLEAATAIRRIAAELSLQVGVLGSAALEIATGLPYTDADSDLDILVQHASYDILFDFYRILKNKFEDIRMDFELELPNGYGVKLAEIFMDTRTVLGKSLLDVALLNKKEVMQFLLQKKEETNYGN
ncbi:MAG: malonate decarboxylase holo-[acyl-carrier-protein] synthase [Phascolarctobacterium sp.]|nr:malonate decarboxylase holo-[acyl-carrier-protein] synthase [Phascolarctobacterium sp.]